MPHPRTESTQKKVHESNMNVRYTSTQFFSYYTQISNSIAPLLDSHRVLVPRALSAIIYHEYSHTPKCTEPNTPTREADIHNNL
ncbi:hypothetical protein HanXRQr2_Chr14g0666011 [Helianthus annuus]|uniref:Uncharacterized protein n=1 Tax=Helianthus annuus TaxID=4232 RepID=A0A9K3ECK5_HELAN|nr:hypothetical protein HanXRQr2_Chr14g0666011 [Helianthus annuus]KAJ0842217.1 hypothetical protein HanPSC8_Chr14g0639121 [Helianthus annuus]